MKHKKIIRSLTLALVLTAICCVPAFAAGTTGDVAGAVEQAWTGAAGQIKTVVDNVVFPALDMILAIAFFGKLAMAYLIIGSMASLSGPAPPSCSPALSSP